MPRPINAAPIGHLRVAPQPPPTATPTAYPLEERITRTAPSYAQVQVLQKLEDRIAPPKPSLTNPEDIKWAIVDKKNKLIEATTLLVALIFGYIYCYGNKDLPFPSDKLKQVVALLLTKDNYSIVDVRKYLTQNVEETKGFVNAIAFYISFWFIKFFSNLIIAAGIDGFHKYFRKEIDAQNKEYNLQNYTALLFETLKSFLADYNDTVQKYSSPKESHIPAEKSRFIKGELKDRISKVVHLPEDRALNEVFKRFAIICTNKFMPTPNIGRQFLIHFITLEDVTIHPLLKIIPQFILAIAFIPLWIIILPFDKFWLNKSIKEFVKTQIQTLTPRFLDAKVPDLIDGRPFVDAINRIVISLLKEALISSKADNEPSIVSEKLRKNLSATAKELLMALDTASLQTHRENQEFAEHKMGIIKRKIEENLVKVVEELFGLTCTYLSKPENANKLMLNLFESLVSAFDKNYIKDSPEEKTFNAQYDVNKKAVRDLMRQIVDQEVKNAVDAIYSGISTSERRNIDKHLLKIQKLAQDNEKGIRDALKKKSLEDVAKAFHKFHYTLYTYDYRNETENTKKAIDKSLNQIYLLNSEFTDALLKQRPEIHELTKILDKIFKKVSNLHSIDKPSKWPTLQKLLHNRVTTGIKAVGSTLFSLDIPKWPLKKGTHYFVAKEVQAYINTAWEDFVFDQNVANGLLHHAIVNILESQGVGDCSKPMQDNV
ncbi:MAG: hypothetical protein HZB76_05625 [Chlamydiae bacterium]|nr:hypothetical protein [Chlamydiota bacterium]